MPVTKTGTITITTPSEEALAKMAEFERQAIMQNQPVIQHGAAMIEEEKAEQKPAVNTSAGVVSSLKLLRLMKKIAGQPDNILIPSAIEFHSASIAEKSVTNNYQQNDNNSNNIIVLRNLMKKICSATGPTLL